ncbi:zinc-ribbon domain-containing protein [Cupriavidus necator]|uniref:zinc-ribbon domain-containing protein n=1 Tax=Cupriavidus necator TaxID=106590 RepID=UPI003AF3C0FF
MQCTHCQSELRPGHHFCGECGRPVAVDATSIHRQPARLNDTQENSSASRGIKMRW